MKTDKKHNTGNKKKNKAVMIALSIIGGILLIALIIFMFFPGLPTCIAAKCKYKHIDELPAEFEKTEVSGEKTTLQGLKMLVPDGWTINEGENGMTSADEKQSLLVLHADLKSQEQALKELMVDPEYAYDPWDAYEKEENDYRYFFNVLNVDLPKYGLSTVFIYYIRDTFTAKSAIWLERPEREIFRELAEVKENAVDTEDMWKMSGDGFKAYVGHIDNEEFGGNMWTVTIFPEENSIDNYSVTMKCSDEKTVRQIISSIELDKKEKQ